MQGFLAEARGYVKNLQKILQSGNGTPIKAQSVQEMHRQMHVLVSSASMLPLGNVANIAGPAADLLQDYVQSGETLDSSAIDRLKVWMASLDAHLNSLIGESAPEAVADIEAAPSSPPAASAIVPQPLDLPTELLDIFSQEASEHLQAIEENLSKLMHNHADSAAMRDMRRAAHTLKGASAAVGIDHVMRLSHLMEEMLEQALDHDQPLADDAMTLLGDSEAALMALLQPKSGSSPVADLPGLDQRYYAMLGAAYPFTERYTPTPRLTTPSTDIAPQPGESYLRIPLANVDLLINQVGEMIINRGMLEGYVNQLREMATEMGYSTRRLNYIARDIDERIENTTRLTARHESSDPTFDPLELDRYTQLYQLMRELEESVADTTDANEGIDRLAEEMLGGLSRERRLTATMQEQLIDARLIPFKELETRLRLIVQRATLDLGKQVALNFVGMDYTIDKNVLDSLSDPLMHLLRNAIDHGIETPELREANYKPPEGMITLMVSRDRSRVVIAVTDDGAGIDFEKVRRHAVEQGIISEQEAMDQERLTDLIFSEGFSTSDTVTALSGRGVGLDIVRRAIRNLQGDIQVDSTAGVGTTFLITVPVSLAITRAIYVRCAEESYAIPLEQVSAVLRLSPEIFKTSVEQDVLRIEGSVYTLHDLRTFIGASADEDLPDQRYGLVIESGGQNSAILVDALTGIHETVVKPMGNHLRRVHGVAGATIAGNGRVVLILNLHEIIAPEHQKRHFRDRSQARRPVLASAGHGHVLVVDDSLSVRHVVSTFLTRSGWQVSTAKDGLEALEQLYTARPDVALVDIEMPRMNGFELLSRVKSEEVLKSIPIVFLTSRGAQKHRDRALQLGADGYLVKPYRDEELLETLREVIQKAS